MVFFSVPRHGRHAQRQQTQPEVAPSTITELADELLILILDNADTPSVLHFRRTCKVVGPACNTAIRNRFTRLYVHPAPRYLENAIKICSHPFAGNIEEVVLIGQPQWREIEKACPGYRSREWQEPVDGRYHPKWQSRFRTWPTVIPPEPRSTPHSIEDSPDAHIDFAAAYTHLIEPLAMLPKLHVLGFAEQSCTPGLNQIPAHIVRGHAQKCASFIDRPFPVSSRTKSSKMVCKAGHADAEVFYNLLYNSRLPFTAMRMFTELPFVAGLAPKVTGSNVETSSEKALRKVDLVLDSGWNLNNLHRHSKSILLGAMCTLQELRIFFAPNALMESSDYALSAYLLETICFPQLKILQLEALESTRSSSHHRVNKRPNRPLLHVLQMPNWLRDHASTLTHIIFKNILFQGNTDPLKPFTGEISDTLLAMEEFPRLVHAEYVVSRYAHDPLCERQDGESMMGCDYFMCGEYSFVNGRDSVDKFEQLAGQLGVQFDAAKRAWDFGEVVMRKRLLATEE